MAHVAEVASILGLLEETHLRHYTDCSGGLSPQYRDAGSVVEFLPVTDHCEAPLSDEPLNQVVGYFEQLPKPALVLGHRRAGLVAPLNSDGSVIEFRARLSGLEELTRWVLT